LNEPRIFNRFHGGLLLVEMFLAIALVVLSVDGVGVFITVDALHVQSCSIGWI
jgi:hypothetical protein